MSHIQNILTISVDRDGGRDAEKYQYPSEIYGVGALCLINEAPYPLLCIYRYSMIYGIPYRIGKLQRKQKLCNINGITCYFDTSIWHRNLVTLRIQCYEHASCIGSIGNNMVLS
jgi:hypothetical protein